MVLVSPLIYVDALAAASTTHSTPDRRLPLVPRPARRRAAAYEAGHIPGAMHLDLDTDLAAPRRPGTASPPRSGCLRRQLEARGIGDEHLVVAYDDVGAGSRPACGGCSTISVTRRRRARRWVRRRGSPPGHPIAMEEPVSPAGAAACCRSLDACDRPRAAPARLGVGRAARRAGRAALSRRDGTDRRLPGPHPDRHQRPDRRQPRVRRHLPDADTLRIRYASLAADGTAGQVVTSCGSGVSACHDALAIRIAGLPDPLLYPGSYSDWTRRGLPVATGPDPGDPI